MKFLFPILAISISAVAAYFSLSQSEKFEEYQAARLLAISTNETVSASAAKADVDIANETALLEESKKNRDLAEASVQALTADANRLKNELAQADADLAAQDAEFAELDNALKEVQKLFAALNLGEDVTMDNLPQKIGEVEDDIKEKRTRMEELDLLVEAARKSLNTKQEEVSRLVARKESRDSRISRNAMEARVTAVDNDWGFLVIGAGSNSGFTPQTDLLIKRDGRLIGKVTPSAIEPTQTIAEINLKTLSPGVRIQPGDRVILAKPAAN